jgi:hypothetical protein
MTGNGKFFFHRFISINDGDGWGMVFDCVIHLLYDDDIL